MVVGFTTTTIYAAKFEQTIIYQHVHLQREIQSHEAAHVLMRLYRRSIARLFTKRKKDVMLESWFRICTLRHIRIEIIHGSQNVF
jgi:hypothetical protein